MNGKLNEIYQSKSMYSCELEKYSEKLKREGKAISVSIDGKKFREANYKNGKCTEFGQRTGNFTVI